MNIHSITEETLRKAQAAIMSGLNPADLSKISTTGIDITSLLAGYNLEAPAKQLVPLLSPFRQYVPRKIMAGGTSVNWKAITAVTPGYAFVAEKAPGTVIAQTTLDKSATYKTMSVAGSVTREAIAASEGFDPALAKETSNVLLSAMMEESKLMMWGVSTALGTPGTPVIVSSTSAGSITQSGTTYYCVIAGLTLKAARRVTLNTVAQSATAGEVTTAGVTGALFAGSGTASGASGVTLKSTEGSSASLTATSKGLLITWAALPGAYAYAVFVGTTTGVANLKLEAIVTGTSIVLTSLAGTGVAATVASASLPTADESADTTAYDGIFRTLNNSTNAGYYKDLANTALVYSASEVTALQDAFAGLYDVSKLAQFRVVVSAKDSRRLTGQAIAAGGGPIIVTNPSDPGRGNFAQGYHLGAIVNATSGDVCPIDVEPWLPQGTMLIFPTNIWYPSANVGSAFDWVGGFDWTRFDYPPVLTAGSARIVPFETACYGALRCLVPAGCGVITGIGPA